MEGNLEKLEERIITKDMKSVIEKIESSTCEIIKDNNSGTGFICQIKFKGLNLRSLLTSFHVISEKDLKKNIKIKLNEKMIELNMKLNRKIFYYKNIGYTCIEILNEDNIKDNIVEINEDIKIIDYVPKGKNESDISSNKILEYSHGRIEYIDDDKCYYDCNINQGCSSGAIISIKTTKIIGLHLRYEENKNWGVCGSDIIKDIH